MFLCFCAFILCFCAFVLYMVWNLFLRSLPSARCWPSKTCKSSKSTPSTELQCAPVASPSVMLAPLACFAHIGTGHPHRKLEFFCEARQRKTKNPTGGTWGLTHPSRVSVPWVLLWASWLEFNRQADILSLLFWATSLCALGNTHCRPNLRWKEEASNLRVGPRVEKRFTLTIFFAMSKQKLPPCTWASWVAFWRCAKCTETVHKAGLGKLTLAGSAKVICSFDLRLLQIKVKSRLCPMLISYTRPCTLFMVAFGLQKVASFKV